jgi:predicted nucleic acid-binding protein
MQTGLLDTSVFIANETSRPLGSFPVEVAISVVTIGELELGVLRAESPEIRRQRRTTLELARSFDPLPITEATMSSWAIIVSACRNAGVSKSVKLMDSLIAATALQHGLAVITQDTDFALIAESIPDLDVLLV